MSKDSPNYWAIIPAHVRYSDITPNAKLLYAEITALSNVKGYCFASSNYFAELYKTTTRSIQNWLKELEDKKFIQREVFYKDNSKQIESRHIYINQDPYGKNLQYLPNEFSVPIENNFSTPCEKNDITPTEKIFIDNNTSINKTRSNNIYMSDSDFEEFWNTYPKKLDKKEAKLKFKKIKSELKEKILSSLEAHKKTEQWKDPKYIPYPKTWLGNERWENELEIKITENSKLLELKAKLKEIEAPFLGNWDVPSLEEKQEMFKLRKQIEELESC